MKLSTLIDQLLKIQNEMDTDPDVSMCVDLGSQLQDRVGEVFMVHGEVMLLNERFDDDK